MSRQPQLPITQLPSSREQTYFTVILIVSILAWLFLLASFLIIWALFFAVFLWFGSGLLAARLRSEAIEINDSQFPELYQSFTGVCERLNLNEIPRLYVMESGGLLNAFTMRFSGRNFVVIYADLLEAFGPNSDEVRFIMGHEIGHIQRNHILKQLLLAPGLLLPLIGSAYSRACETTCDRYGAFAADNVDASVNAMLALAGGKQAGRFFDPDRFAQQHTEERGFLYPFTSSRPVIPRSRSGSPS